VSSNLRPVIQKQPREEEISKPNEDLLRILEEESAAFAAKLNDFRGEDKAEAQALDVLRFLGNSELLLRNVEWATSKKPEFLLVTGLPFTGEIVTSVYRNYARGLVCLLMPNPAAVLYLSCPIEPNVPSEFCSLLKNLML
jgi:hypothetical protein